MPKVLIMTGDAAESLEVMYPYQRLLEEGYEVDIAAPSKKKLQFVVHDFVEGFDTYTEKLGYTWDADVAFADVDPSDYVALVIPGRTGARVHPERRRRPADHQGVLPATTARSPTSATARSRSRRRACSAGGAPPRTRRSSPMSSRPAPSTWTAAGWSTATWCPAGPGRTIRSGCGSSCGCCGSTRRSSRPSLSPADPALLDGALHDLTSTLPAGRVLVDPGRRRALSQRPGRVGRGRRAARRRAAAQHGRGPAGHAGRERPRGGGGAPRGRAAASPAGRRRSTGASSCPPRRCSGSSRSTPRA